MRILLVQAWLGRTQHPVFPYGLAAVASRLTGHETEILDLNLFDSPMEYLEARLREFAPDVTGFSLRNCDTTNYSDPFSYLPAFSAQVDLAARTSPSTHLMAGGAGFSIFPGEIMQSCPMLQCGVVGHGEKVVRNLVESQAKGLYHGGAGETGQPALSMVDYRPYTGYQENLSTGVEINRGCGIECSYCSYPAVSGNTVLERPLKQIERDVRTFTEAGARHLFFIAPVLNSTRDRGIRVAKAVASIGGFTWEAYHTATGFDGEYAELLAESGCTAVSFSPDGGTRRQMELMCKDYGPDVLEQALDAAAAAGLSVSLNIFPWFAETGVRGMLEAFRNGRRWGSLAGGMLKRLRFGLVRRMPGTCYEPAKPSFTASVGPGEFVKPPPASMVVFHVMNRLCERKLVQ